METRYPPGHVFRTMALDGLIFIIGASMLLAPFLFYYVRRDAHFFPGDIDTTSHVALGALIATLAVFRVLLAYGSPWVEVVLFFLGLITLRMPQIMVMQWNHDYTIAHLIAGGGVMVLSLLSGLLTLGVMRQLPQK